MSESSPVNINILDKDYLVGCPSSEKDALLESARILDNKMRDVRDNGGVLGNERIAVITALNLIHELVQDKKEQANLSTDINSGINRIYQKIENTLGKT